MKETLLNLVPNHSEEYKISTDKLVLNPSIEIFNYLLDSNKIIPTHTYKDIPYRWAYGAEGNNSIDKISNSLPSSLSTVFQEKIIDYLGIKNLFTNEIKFEILGPNEHVDDIHLRRCRFGDIKPIKEDNFSKNYQNEIFYSSIWHTDKTFKLNNYKLLLYLNDIPSNQGGLILADPIISPKYINNKCVLLKENTYINVDKIKEKEVIGKAGTTISFNSHILHRANLPKSGYRYCFHLSFLLPEEKHYHCKYSQNHFNK